MSLQTVKQELRSLSIIFSKTAEYTNTVNSTINNANMANAIDIIEPSKRLLQFLYNNSRYVETAGSDFRKELEIILADYTNDMADWANLALVIADKLTNVVDMAQSLYVLYVASESLGVSGYPNDYPQIKQVCADLTKFSSDSAKLAKQATYWDETLVERR